MKRNLHLIPVLVALAASVLAGCATTSAPQDPAEWDGLVRQSGTRLHAVFLKPGAQIGAFDSVLLDPVSISFATSSSGEVGVARSCWAVAWLKRR